MPEVIQTTGGTCTRWQFGRLTFGRHGRGEWEACCGGAGAKGGTPVGALLALIAFMREYRRFCREYAGQRRPER